MENNSLQKLKKTRILGLDFGLARIGVALSDETKILASPLYTLKCEKQIEQTVKKLLIDVVRYEKELHFTLEEYVIGHPLLMSGKTGFLADEVKHFVEILKQHTPLPITLWDERLTTVQAERSLRESNLSRKQRSARVDTVAAVIILQNYLDSRIRKCEQQ